MKYITDTISYPSYCSKAFQLYFAGMDIGVLDIETTGLNPQRSKFVLGGLLTPGEKQLEATQFFAETLEEEQETLRAYGAAVREKDLVLTYNGQHFDIPFIKGRSREPLDLPFNLDLYLLVKSYSPIRAFLPNLKQKTVENFMGFWEHRKDEISGKESVDLYYSYLSSKDPEVRDKILLHNHDDIVQLYRLLKVLEKSDFHKAMSRMGFPIRSQNGIRLVIERISTSENQLHIRGRQRYPAVSYRCFEWNDVPCSAHFDQEEETFAVSIPLIRHSGLTLVDLRALKMDIAPFEKYPGCQEGFLILEEPGKKHYLQTNHFIKLFLERILNQWIIKK